MTSHNEYIKEYKCHDCLFTVFDHINTSSFLLRCAVILVFFQKPFSSGKMIPKRQVECSSHSRLTVKFLSFEVKGWFGQM